ncbi:MAG: hypothetical protein WAN21_02385 [Candidatus Sulfotelmatobacter sp.]
MNRQEKRRLTLLVADIYATEPDAKIADVAQRLGYSVWEIRMACYRGDIPLKVGRPKAKVS